MAMLNNQMVYNEKKNIYIDLVVKIRIHRVSLIWSFPNKFGMMLPIP